MENKPLKISILCSGTEFDRWEAHAIKEVMKLSGVKIVHLIVEKNDEKPKTFFSAPLQYPYRNLLWRLYKRFRLKIPAYDRIDLSEELKGTPLDECKPELKGKFSQHFSENDLGKIRSYEPDIILRFAFNILRGEILTLPKYGVWSYHHADEQIIRGGPAAFWEIMNGIPKTGAILQRLTEKLDSGVILRKGFFKTVFHSHRANLDQLLMYSADWMKQAIIDIQNGSDVAMHGTPVSTNAPVFTYATNGEMVKFFFRIRSGKRKFHFNELFKAEKWNIGIVRNSAADIIRNGSVEKVEWFDALPRGRYVADPFGWKENDTLQIVAEEYDYKTRVGFISVINGGNSRTLIKKNEHLSYPYTIVRNGTRQIIPECFQSGKLLMIDPVSKKEKILLENFAAVDATPVYFNGKWWIFCTEGGDMSNTQLHIFHSDSLDGNWKAHANNPVKTDISDARPGGTPFMHEGKLIRPAQDCSTTYGAAVVLNEIIELTENTFLEKKIRRLEPKPVWKFNKGLHTFSIVDDNTILIDARTTEFNLPNFIHKLNTKVVRFFTS